MTYNPSIPTPTELLSTSQGQILINFGQLNTQYGADHDGFNGGSGNGSGMHDQITFLANQAAPSLTRNSVAGVSGLYANAVGGLSQLFFQNASQNRQITGDLLVSSGTNYGFQTPWGIKINFGSVTVAANSSATITYAVPLTSVLSLQATTQSTNANNTCTVNNINGSTGTIYRVGSGTEACYYVAIGT